MVIEALVKASTPIVVNRFFIFPFSSSSVKKRNNVLFLRFRSGIFERRNFEKTLGAEKRACAAVDVAPVGNDRVRRSMVSIDPTFCEASTLVSRKGVDIGKTCQFHLL
jgi:hypothetical protein